MARRKRSESVWPNQPREKVMLKTRLPSVWVEALWRALSMGGVTGRARVGSGRRVKARRKLTSKGTISVEE